MVAVVRQGEIVEQGSHGELIQIPNGAYATLVRLQASTHHHPDLLQKQQPIAEQLQHSADPDVLRKVISSQVHAFLFIVNSPGVNGVAVLQVVQRCRLPMVGSEGQVIARYFERAASRSWVPLTLSFSPRLHIYVDGFCVLLLFTFLFIACGVISGKRLLSNEQSSGHPWCLQQTHSTAAFLAAQWCRSRGSRLG